MTGENARPLLRVGTVGSRLYVDITQPAARCLTPAAEAKVARRGTRT